MVLRKRFGRWLTIVSLGIATLAGATLPAGAHASTGAVPTGNSVAQGVWQYIAHYKELRACDAQGRFMEQVGYVLNYACTYRRGGWDLYGEFR